MSNKFSTFFLISILRIPRIQIQGITSTDNLEKPVCKHKFVDYFWQFYSKLFRCHLINEGQSSQIQVPWNWCSCSVIPAVSTALLGASHPDLVGENHKISCLGPARRLSFTDLPMWTPVACAAWTFEGEKYTHTHT